MWKFILPLLALTSAPALAEQEAESIRVSIVDLDLSTPAGQATLESRVRGAVRALCPMPPLASLTERWEARRCAKEADAGTNAAVRLAIEAAKRDRADRGIATASR